MYRGEHLPPRSSEDIWEESIVLIEAMDETQAVLSASGIAKEPFEYKTAAGGALRWTFDSVSRVFAIDAGDLTHGVELFSRFLRSSEVASLKTPFPEV